MMLKGMQMFFLTSWMQMKNGLFQVEEVTTVESLTIVDVKCLWDDIKQVGREVGDERKRGEEEVGRGVRNKILIDTHGAIRHFAFAWTLFLLRSQHV
jgi:hypothetical protein